MALAQTATTTGTDQAGSSLTQRHQVHGIRGSSELQQKIAALGSVAAAAVTMPVLFGVAPSNLTPNFGDLRDGGTRTHEGEDIMAVKGTPIVSPTPAVVLRTGVGASEGNYVYTANPGGETFVYMHLDRVGEGVASGVVLAEGALIGYVGNTGNAAGGPAHLHFEIHNSSGTPVDPYLRLTSELPLQSKITDLATILTQTTDATALAQLLVTNFRSTFVAARTAGINLPIVINDALTLVPIPTASASARTLPTGELDLGSSGSAVSTLQHYLIQAASGPAAVRLGSAGATGSFGPITQAALAEYQLAVGISPASGYYGAATRAYVEAHPATAQTIPVATTPTASGTLVRSLERTMVGEDVRTLQKLLNTHGYTIATTGSGSTGNETTYFGAATEAAVIKFQIAHNIVPAVGYVGPITRAALATLAV